MTFRKSYKTHRTCASPIPPFRESLPALLSFLPDETRLGLHGVAAQSCRIMCGQVRSAKVGLAQSPEVHGHADGWSGSLWLLHSWNLAGQESKWERTRVLDVLQLWVCAVCPTTPQRAGEEESTWLGGWRKESWNHLDFSLSEPYDVTDVSPSGEWNEADLEWR